MTQVKILHFSPHDENDGIAKYQEQYLAGMEQLGQVDNKFFDTTPNQYRHQTADQKQETLGRLKSDLQQADVFHIQHEFGLFDNEDFLSIVNIAKESGKKVVISVHLSPGFAIKSVHRGGLGPKSLIAYARDLRHRKRMIARHVQPMIDADRLLVHNDVTADSLVDFGVDRNKIVKIPHPVYEWDTVEKTHYIKDALNYQEGDVIYCTVGMLHRYKGIFDAVRALKFLPENYKLAILGGMHPMSDEVAIYNKICDLIDKLNLKDRVFITGFVEDDNDLNSYIQECDISVFPYDGFYYGHLSSGSINLALSNDAPVIAYPTRGFKELAASADGAVVLCQTYAYYELARELKNIDIKQQKRLSAAYADKMAWRKMSAKLAEVYTQL
jgi:glycosyltransferase involved in cell wall biosynthesis